MVHVSICWYSDGGVVVVDFVVAILWFMFQSAGIVMGVLLLLLLLYFGSCLNLPV